jgi:hypothetical protein
MTNVAYHDTAQKPDKLVSGQGISVLVARANPAR